MIRYLAPSVVLSFIYTRSATELQSPKGPPFPIMVYEAKAELCYKQK